MANEQAIRITEADLQELWRINPLAHQQIINIMQARYIQELETRLNGAEEPESEAVEESS